ncbi:MAG: ATP synthase F0 subunit B [Candidatus Dadabacteria bacterium]|nr:ATP synthase F0 subunit B [Candidatus Dadabacteria bacterium]MYB27190.1 ATP synthase F0 subunit B [Candidatus Dadabacteria bacterium]
MRFYGLRTFLYAAIFALTVVPSADAAENMLSVDETLIIQLVIFLVGLFLLNRLVFRPLIGVWDRRDELTAGTLREAEEMTRKAEGAIAEYNEKIAEARVQATETRNELRQQGQGESSRMLLSAREAAQAELEGARGTLESETAKIRADLQGEIESLAAEISNRVLRKGA